MDFTKLDKSMKLNNIFKYSPGKIALLLRTSKVLNIKIF